MMLKTSLTDTDKMRELSLHILDIVQNSISANAKNISVEISEQVSSDTLTIVITDDGKGMSEDFLSEVVSPFATTRTTRKVGLGIPLFKEAAEETGGNFTIESTPGKGTCVTAVFGYSHIDRQPLGDIASVMFILVQGNPNLDFVYKHRVEENEFVFDTKQIRSVLGKEVGLDRPEILSWISECLKDGISELYGGK